MIRADVLVVGAGPSGATAAKYLADSGLSVILFDRAVFPREKACGDGVTADGISALARLGLSEWSRQFAEMDILRLTSPDQQILDVWIQAKDGKCNGRTIPRKTLDNRLVQSAIESGARFLDNTRVKNVELQDDRVRVQCEGQAAEGQLVLLAEGSQASICRRLGLLDNTSPDLIAVRQYLAGDTGPANRLEIHFHSWILPGYNWIFPLGGGNTNIGSGTYTRRVKSGEIDLPAVLERFKRDPINEGRMEKTEDRSHIKGHPLRTQFGHTRTHASRLMVLGDAAGLINPFSGEGIAPAIESGEIAAAIGKHAFEQGNFSKGFLSSYTRALQNKFLPDRRAARFLHNAMNSPWILNRLFRILKQNSELAMLVALMIIGQKSPRLIYRPSNLLKLLSR